MEKSNSSIEEKQEPEFPALTRHRRRVVLLSSGCISLHRPASPLGRIGALAHGQELDTGHADTTGCAAPYGAAYALCEHLVRAGGHSTLGVDFGPDDLTGGAYVVAGSSDGELAVSACPAFASDLASDLDAACVILDSEDISLFFSELRTPLWLALAPERVNGRGWRPWLVSPAAMTALDFLEQTAGFCGSVRLTSGAALLEATRPRAETRRTRRGSQK